MHLQESGPRGGGSKLDPPSFFSLAFAVGVICFPVGVQPPQPPANFYPAPLSRACVSSYLYSVVAMSLSCSVYEIFNVK